MTLYLFEATNGRYVLELYKTPTERTHWSDWQNSAAEALAVPLEKSPRTISIEERIDAYNRAHGVWSDKTLRVHSTYTPHSHPELFL